MKHLEIGESLPRLGGVDLRETTHYAMDSMEILHLLVEVLRRIESSLKEDELGHPSGERVMGVRPIVKPPHF